MTRTAVTGSRKVKGSENRYLVIRYNLTSSKLIFVFQLAWFSYFSKALQLSKIVFCQWLTLHLGFYKIIKLNFSSFTLSLLLYAHMLGSFFFYLFTEKPWAVCGNQILLVEHTLRVFLLKEYIFVPEPLQK